MVTVTNTPEVESVVVNEGAVQRSIVRSLTVTFNTQVAIEFGAFVVVNTTTNTDHVPTVTTMVDTTGRTVATLTFASELTDGNYTLTVKRDKITANGNAMFADRTDDFFRLFGESDGDRDVDLFDFVNFRRSYGKKSTEEGFESGFDHDENGRIDMFDFAEFRNQFSRRLPR